MTYLYVPQDESEYGPVWEESEALSEFTPEELSDARPAVLVLSLDGARGHYLAAGYLACVADLSDVCQEDTDEWNTVADAYERHQGLRSGDSCMASPVGKYDPETGLCEGCEFIHDDTDRAESVLDDLGYVTIWNDGVQVWSIRTDVDGNQES